MSDILPELVDNWLADSHLYVDSMQMKAGRVIIVLDGDCGANLGECARLNRYLHRRLEERGIDVGDVSFDISSPGLDKELRTRRDFMKNVGRAVRGRLNTGKTLKGILLAVSPQDVLYINATGKTLALPMKQLNEAKVAI